MWSFGLNSCLELLSYTLWRLLYPGEDKSKRTTAGPVKTFVAVGLNLLKESEISAPQPEEITFFILFSIVILQFYYLVSFFTNTIFQPAKLIFKGIVNFNFLFWSWDVNIQWEMLIQNLSLMDSIRIIINWALNSFFVIWIWWIRLE